jgi:hypothetical protein
MAGLLARGSLPIADLPGNAQWSVMATGSPLTVAGAATASAPVRVVLTVFPINPLDFVRRGTIAFTLSGRLAPVNEAKIPVVPERLFEEPAAGDRDHKFLPGTRRSRRKGPFRGWGLSGRLCWR